MSGSGILLHIEVQFSAGVWTEITSDVIPMVDFGYGITGITPNDRVADAGPLSLALDNGISNSVHLEGAYVPGHSNCRAGFDIGIAIRLWYEYQPSIPKYYKYQGTITRIEPPGSVEEFRTMIQCVDWFDTASSSLVPNLTVQLNKRSDDLVTTLFNAMIASNQPPNRRMGAGMETMPVAFDTAQTEGVYVSGELQKICNSEMGFSYPTGDASLSGIVAFEDRRRRGANVVSVATFTGVNLLRPVRDRERVLDRVQVRMHPRTFDTSPTTIFTNADSPLVIQKQTYGPIICTYKDNSQTQVRIGATNQITPVAITDFLANTLADGSGTDLTANFQVTACSFYADHAEVSIKNNGTVDGYLTFFRIRGQGYYDEGEVLFEAKDSVHQTSLQDRPLSFEMPYQGDTTIAAQAAAYLLSVNNTVFTFPETFGFTVCDNATALQAIQREISDRITVQDTKSGISADFFINRIRHSIDVEGVLRVEFTLCPASATTYWILDSAVYSVLGSTTTLSYGLWNQFWVLGSASLGVLGTTTKLS